MLSARCPGDGRLPGAAADRRVAVHRAAAQPAEEPHVLHTVVLRHGPHVLHPLHVHGELTQTRPHPLVRAPTGWTRTVGSVPRMQSSLTEQRVGGVVS